MSSHNLQLESYSLRELLGLFDLNPNDIKVDDLKRAKKKVLMMHPDKSKLDPSYFLFYKKAFDVIVVMYENVLKMSQTVEDQEYIPDKSNKELKKNIQNMDKKKFHKEFNEIFEKHGSKTIDSSKNDWFTSTEALYAQEVSSSSSSSVHGSIDRIKERQNQIITHRGVVSCGGGFNNNELYENEDQEYVECDPFSKLKYDDLRKVHKDQTVFAVRESDMVNVTQYKNVEEYKRARHLGNIKPMERSHAEEMIREQDRLVQEKMRQKQYQSELVTMQNIETNKKVMANFLKLKGGAAPL
jgi:hypothetical protein